MKYMENEMSEFELYNDDCLNVLKTMDNNSIDSCVTDPPYGLSFMGKAWDYDVPKSEIWKEVFRVLKPGGHLLAFFGSRTYHRGVVQIEDAGFEIRDQIMWLYGSGFPKSHNIGDGWGTALKPAHEPIVVARKPINQSVAKNVLEYGTGALNIDGCRVEFQSEEDKSSAKPQGKATSRIGQLAGKNNSYVILGKDNLYWSNDNGWVDRESASIFYEEDKLNDPIGTIKREPATERNDFEFEQSTGRWPANVIHDGSLDEEWKRYFYCAKASKSDKDEGLEALIAKKVVSFQTGGGASGKPSSLSAGRNTEYKNTHPTVKPTELMKYLCRLVTPKNGTVLDPFMGSGTTGKAAAQEGFKFIGIEMSSDYFEIAEVRVKYAYDNDGKEPSLEDFFG